MKGINTMKKEEIEIIKKVVEIIEVMKKGIDAKIKEIEINPCCFTENELDLLKIFEEGFKGMEVLRELVK